MMMKYKTLEDPTPAEDSEWHYQRPPDMAAMQRFVGEKSWRDKTSARKVTENSQPPDFLMLYLQPIAAVIVQETNRCKQQDPQARSKPDITYRDI
jgi:hypothetical protein